MSKEMVVYFSNSRMARFDPEKVTFVRLAEKTNEEYTPDISDGKAVINWDNVAFIKEWSKPEEIDL